MGCDGPNVNNTVLSLFQETLKTLKFKPLIDLGTCDIHIVHNVYLRGCDKLSLDPSDFIVKVFTIGMRDVKFFSRFRRS